MKIAALLLVALALAGCGHYRTEDEERAAAASAMTIWEAAEAIRIGRDPTGPLRVIQYNASTLAGWAGFPYPIPKVTP
jgi:hypothetical protein